MSRVERSGWCALNRQRLALIDADMRRPLTEVEEEGLAAVEAELDRRFGGPGPVGFWERTRETNRRCLRIAGEAGRDKRAGHKKNGPEEEAPQDRSA